MADNSNQIGILFGVEGGADINGASGAKIAEQLQAIANKLDGKIKFVASLDKSKTRKAILEQLKDIQSDIKLGLPEIDKDSSDKAINSFRSMSKKLSSAMADLTGFGGASFRNQNGFLLDKDLKSFQGSSKEILDKVKRFQTDYSKVAADMNKLQIGGTFSITKDNFQDANKVYQEFENLKLQAKQLRAINATFKAEKTGDLSHLKVLDSVTKYLQKYGDVMSKNTPGSYQKMIELSEKLKGGSFTGQGGAAQQEFLDIATNARLAGGEVETLGQKFKRVFDEKFGYGVLATLALYARQGIIQVYNNVVNLDTAMTELKKVTDETDATYNKFLDKAAERAEKLGATMSDVVSSTADFSRLGYSLDEATELANAAIVYKNVGDGISDISESSESIISTMKAFGIEAKDVMTIVDKYNEVGNKFAISSKGVGDVLLRSASALQTAGNTLDEAIALGTSANSVTQDPEKVGVALKTISMYLRSAKTDLEDAGESVEGMVESTPKLQALLKGIAGVDILQADGTTFKSTYQILKELSQVWDNLTDVNKASVLEAIGGKRNANVTSALIKNFSEAEKVLATSQNSSGSALSENEKYLDSINGKISQLKAQFEDISRQVLSSDTVKWTADLLQNVLNLVDGLAKTKTLLPTIFALIATNKGLGVWGTDNLGNMTVFGKTKEQKATNSWLGSLVGQNTFGGMLRPGLNLNNDQMKSLKAFNAEIQTGTSSIDAYKMHLQGADKTVKQLAVGLKSGKVAMQDIELATTQASTAMTIFNSIKSMALNVGVSVLISLVTTAISYMSRLASWEYKVEQLDKKISDSTDKIDKYQSEIDSLESAQEKLTAAKGNKEELVKVQTELNKLLGAAPDLINGEANAYDKAQQQIKDQIEVNKKMIQVEQDRVVANNKQKFESAKVSKFGFDLSGQRARAAQKEFSKIAKQLSESNNKSYSENLQNVFFAAQLNAFDIEGVEIASEVRELGVSAFDWEAYWNTQVSTALEVFKTTIDNYQGYGGATFIRNVIEGMVRDGLSLDEINAQINSAELDALNSDYFQGLINSLQEARLKGDTDAAGTALNNIKVAIDNLKKVCPSATTYLDTFWDAIANGGKTTSENTEKLNDFLDVTKSLTNSFKDIDSKKSAIADMLAEVRDDGGLSSKSMSSLFDDFSGVEGFENYIKVLTSSKSSTNQLQDALNGLYGAYIDSKSILNDVTEETFDYAQAQLKALGVTNSADVVALSLATSLTKAAFNKKTLTNETVESIRQQMLEKGASQSVANQYVQSAKACVEAQSQLTIKQGGEVAKRVANMGIELSAIKSVADAHSQMLEKMKDSLGLTGVSTVMNQFSTLGQMKEYFDEKFGAGTWDYLESYGKQAQVAANALATLNDLKNQITKTGSGGFNVSVDPAEKAGKSTDSHKKAFDDWYTKLKWQRDNNIIDETNFLQQLDYKYQNHYADRSKYLEEYAKYSQEVYEGFKKLYQDDLNAQKDELKKLADARKQALEDAKDEEDYKKDQSEKREEINKLKVLIASFRGTLSLSSQKKLRELQQQLKEKEEELNDFEKDKALERAKDQIDKEYESQEKAINEQIKGIDERLEQVNKDLPSIRSAIYDFAKKYGVTITRAYASGTSSVPAITQENGAEIIAGNVRRGQFTMLTPTSKVWNASATQALWDFANSPQSYLSSVMDKISSFKQKAMSMIYSQPVNVNVGGITVNGNADNQTVQKIKHSQKEQVEEILKTFKKLQ